MKRINLFYSLLGLPATLILLGSCQAVFTYSPLEFLQRDVTSLPPEQQVGRAEDALSSGDTVEMKEAYDAVSSLLEASPEDTELQLLAADLAFGASGVTEVFTSILQDPEALAESTPEDLVEILDTLDLDLIAEGTTLIESAVAAEAEVAAPQLILASASIIASAADEAGGFEELATLDENDPADAEVIDKLESAQQLLGAVEDEGTADLLEMLGIDFSFGG
ncbi:MAG: hypothetical protein CMN78_05500 [Spirochaetales bacterium]|nr:hypothetical protein [Spirochaetales bacterium]